ncbi:dynamin family protein [Neglectibacter timonensis]|uniref:dynamin family protein n=1 Tax=Neglectibacter timonensis TaxID=1776382 RepID=UPI0039966DFD
MKARICTTESTTPVSLDFRTQQIIQLADIDGHIRFIQALMGKYSFPSEQKAQLQTELKKIQDRQNEKALNMAVIGEFSSGKSSFINALLRENLLEADAIQGTTVASTLIGYSPERMFCTYGRGGKGKQTRSVENAAALAKLLAAYTSGNRKDENAQHLEVGYPSDFLQQGIRIIDTPGTNSLEQWHEDVTKEAIREQADACIILTSAEKPFPESFCRFLEDNLEDVLQTCVFVVTKIDLVPPKQQARQLEYIRKVLKEKLSVHDPLVLPYSALPVINGTGTEYIEGNRETEERILKFLQEQRIRIQLQRCMALSENAMGRLKESMEQISSQQEQRHLQLMQAVTTDLQGFVMRKKSEISLSYQENTNEKLKAIGENVDVWIRDKKREVYEAFQKPATESGIRDFLQTKLNPLLEEKKSEILKNAGISAESSSKYLSEIQSIAEGHCRRFEADFKREYRQLELLAHDLVQEVDKSVRLDDSLMTNIQANIAIRQKVEANVKQSNRGFMGYAGAGAAAGAAIGSVVPIIGTTAGAVIGAVAGFMRFSKKSDDSSRGTAFRNQVAGDVNAVVEQYFRSLKDSVLQFFYQNAANCWMQVERVMDQYLTQYTGIVHEMRKRDQHAQEEAALKIRAIQGDISLTQQQLEQIKSVRYKISQM